jgi:hypothetical protein
MTGTERLYFGGIGREPYCPRYLHVWLSTSFGKWSCICKYVCYLIVCCVTIATPLGLFELNKKAAPFFISIRKNASRAGGEWHCLIHVRSMMTSSRRPKLAHCKQFVAADACFVRFIIGTLRFYLVFYSFFRLPHICMWPRCHSCLAVFIKCESSYRRHLPVQSGGSRRFRTSAIVVVEVRIRSREASNQ